MALTRTIPIKDRIFSSEAISALLKELSSYHKVKDAPPTNRYRLDISEDEYTTISTDSPPQSFEPLLTTPIRHLSLRIDTYSPNREVELTLYHGSGGYPNSLRLYSNDEDWVNLTHGKMSKLLNTVEEQSRFLHKYGVALTFPFAFAVGWPLQHLLLIVLKWFGQTKQVPWSWTLFSQHLFIAGILGFIPSAWLLGHAARAYPTVEMQVGPKHFWKEARSRTKIRVILAFAIIAPSANLMYDFYRLAFTS